MCKQTKSYRLGAAYVRVFGEEFAITIHALERYMMRFMDIPEAHAKEQAIKNSLARNLAIDGIKRNLTRGRFITKEEAYRIMFNTPEYQRDHSNEYFVNHEVVCKVSLRNNVWIIITIMDIPEHRLDHIPSTCPYRSAEHELILDYVKVFHKKIYTKAHKVPYEQYHEARTILRYAHVAGVPMNEVLRAKFGLPVHSLYTDFGIFPIVHPEHPEIMTTFAYVPNMAEQALAQLRPLITLP